MTGPLKIIESIGATHIKPLYRLPNTHPDQGEDIRFNLDEHLHNLAVMSEAFEERLDFSKISHCPTVCLFLLELFRGLVNMLDCWKFREIVSRPFREVHQELFLGALKSISHRYGIHVDLTARGEELNEPLLKPEWTKNPSIKKEREALIFGFIMGALCKLNSGRCVVSWLAAAKSAGSPAQPLRAGSGAVPYVPLTEHRRS